MTTQKIAIISDIHGNLPALEVVACDIQARQPDLVINLGDHLSGPLWPLETAQFLMRQNWTHIRGNHDRQLVEEEPQQQGFSDQYAYRFLGQAELEWLRAMPATLTFQDEIIAFHGSPGNDKTNLLETIAQGRTNLATPDEIRLRLGNINTGILLCGHTHVPRVVQFSDNLLIINPGSIGLQAYEDGTPEYHVSENGSPHARYAILEKQDNNWVVEQIVLPYEHYKAAQKAAKNNRPEWAYALKNGFMKA